MPPLLLGESREDFPNAIKHGLFPSATQAVIIKFVEDTAQEEKCVHLGWFKTYG